MAIDVVGFGALNMDHLYMVERIRIDGECPVLDYRLAPGGSAANTIYGLAKLGVTTGFLGAVGNDSHATALLEDFETAGVDTSRVRSKEAPTGVTLCLTDGSGNRAIYLMPGANALLTTEDIDRDYLRQAKLVHLSSFVDDTQLEVQEKLVAGLPPSVTVAFAPGSIYAARGLQALSPILRATDVLFVNRQEIEELTNETYRNGARTLQGLGCRIVAVTLGKGSEGRVGAAVCYVLSGENEFAVEVRNGDRVAGDAVGAGDAFATGFLYGLIQDRDLETCGYWGHLVARFCVSRAGAREGLPSLAEFTGKNTLTG